MDKETLEKIRVELGKAEAELKKAQPDIDDARKAGIDVTEQVKTQRALELKISQMKSVYGSKK